MAPNPTGQHRLGHRVHVCVHTSAWVCCAHVPEHVCGLGPAADTEQLQVLPHLTLLTALLPWLSLLGGLFAGPATLPWKPVEGAPQASPPATAALGAQLPCPPRLPAHRPSFAQPRGSGTGLVAPT